MKKLKRTLAFALVLCMLCSFLPAGAFAAGNDAPAITGTDDAPFKKGTGGSNSFRIPAIVTLSDGTLVAAADARWNTTYDGGGLDTMVAISTDGGQSWEHSFANYLGDNGNQYDGAKSTCFIDPSLAVYTTDVNNDGTGEDTIFMLCDLYPYGVAINGSGNTAPSTAVGFNNAGKLLLSGDNHTSYGYYLDGHVIRDANGDEVPGLTVDAHFNVTGTYDGKDVNSNLFFFDSPFKVVRTGFLYLTKSTDGGKSWSDPELLNLKTGDEQVCLVGPGGGMVTSKGVIVFPVYSYSNGTERTGLIYSEDGGQTWERSASLDMHSSEADAVELDNGELRVFFRNKTGRMHYADYNLSTGSWGTPVDTGVRTNSNTQLSAITYSLSVEDNGVEKTVILVSCPASANLEGSGDSNGSWRTSGRIFAGLVDPETYEMKWLDDSFPLTRVATSELKGNYTAEQGFFAYSSMTQKYESNDLAVLYENNQFGWGTSDDNVEKYYTIAYKTVTEEALAEALGVTFVGNNDIDDPGTDDGEESLTVILGSPATATIDGVCLENGSAEDEFASIEWVGTKEEPFSAATLPTTSGSSIEAYISDGNDNYLTLDGSSLVNVTDIAKATKWTISYLDKNSGYNRYRVKSGDYYVALGSGTLVASTSTSNTSHFYTADRGFFGSSNGGNVWQYSTNSTSWTVGDSGSRNGKAYTYTPTHTTVTVTGKKLGWTSFLVGNTQYDITVNSTASKIEEVKLKLDETKTYTDKTDNYVNAEENVEPDDAIVGMKLSGADGVYTSGGFINLQDLNAANTGKYIIKNSQSGKLVNNINDNSALHLDGSQTSFTKSAVWTITASGNGYTVQDLNGKYMTIGNNSASVVDGEKVLTLTYNSDNSKYVLADGDYKLNQYGGSSSTRAAGWNNEDNGSKFEIHRFAGTLPSTEITFEGVLPGKTIAVVGDTQYNITVEPDHEEDVDLDLGESKVYTDTTGNYANEIRLDPDPKIAKMTVTGETTTTKHLSEKVSAIESGRTYVLYNKSARKLMNNQWASAAVGGGGTDGLGLSSALNNFQDNDCWTIKASGNGYTVQDRNGKYLSIARGKAVLKDTPVVLNIAFDSTDWTIGENGEYANNYGGAHSAVAGWNDINDHGAQWEIYEVITNYTYSTDITFEAVSEGTTTAVVGTTLYKIKVAPKHDVVDIELEVGETYTYTDTTGNYSRRVGQYPDRQLVSMTVDGETVYVKELVPVDTLVSGKQYLIVNNYSREALTATHTTINGQWEGRDALITAPDVNPDSKHFWTFTETTGGYYVTTGAKYLTVAGFVAYAGTTYQNPLTLTYTADGWTIFDAKTGPDMGHEGNGYYLADNMDQNNYTGGAQGNATLLSDGRSYWTIYEVVQTNELDHATTTVTFEGLKTGDRTSAIVGNTYYYITVVEKEVDDEVQRIGTKVWDVDPEIQQANYEAWANMPLDGYTDESWDIYHDARVTAVEELYRVSQATYASEAEAEAALKALQTVMDAFEAAKNALVPAKTITINYQLDGNTILTRNYKIAQNATTMALDETIVVEVNDTRMAYTVNEGEHHGGEASYANGILTLPAVDNKINVSVSVMGALGNGFVGSENLTGQHNGILTCTLVDKPITAMTVTQGIKYTLLLKDALTDGQTVEWSTDNPDVATVDQNGKVTSVDPGETNIIAKIYENGELVQVNSIPITVMENNYESSELTRKVALYTEQIDNTTIWCVFNGDTTRAFEVIEGELIYGNFEKASSSTDRDINKTTAFSFFGDPDEAHALVYMNAVNTEGDFYLLHENGEIRDGNEYFYDTKDNDGSATRGAGLWQALGLMTPANPDKNGGGVNDADWTIVKAMVEWAIAQHCDGGQGFTRRAEEGDIATNLSFVSDPMPTIEKAVDGVLPTTRKFANYRRFSETTDHYAAVNEQIYFTINVTLKAPTQWRKFDSTKDQHHVTVDGIQYAADADGNKFSAITYSNALLTDDFLEGAFLYTKELDNEDGLWDGEVPVGSRRQFEDITNALNAAWTPAELEAGERVFPFYLIYTVQESDMSRSIIENIADLNFGYQSHYSRGAQKGAADAEASIRIVGYAIDDVVIDFGQPVVYEGHDYYVNGMKDYTFKGLTSTHLSGAYYGDETKATAKYGTVRVDLIDGKYTVKYTPTSILRDSDTILIYGPGVGDNNDKLVNAFTIYPASTVYYEESFLTTNGWSSVGNAQPSVNQAFELLGMSEYNEDGKLLGKVTNKKYPYGYDPIYDGYVDEDEGNLEVTPSAIVSSNVGDTAEFTFTGTGFELFANCSESSGYIGVEILKGNGQPVKILMVNTVVKAGTTGATSGQGGQMNALPVVSVKDLEHGVYTVRVTKIMADDKSVVIDGVRIFNTLADSAVYAIDLEDNPEFYQLRDAVLKGINIQDYLGDSMYQKDLEEGANQVFASISGDSEAPTATAIITSVGDIYTDMGEKAPQDLLDNGPKNELYLWPEQTLTFKVSTNRVIQVGMKAPCTDTSYTARVLASDSVTPAVLAGDVSGETDMFYSLTASPNAVANNYYLVSISNIGNDILSITDLKVCDDPSGALAPLTQDDIYQILIDSGYTDEGETPDEPLPFLDVPVDSYYYDSVAWALKNQITSGVSENHFGPDVNCDRAQVVTFLWRAFGSPEPTLTDNPFVDVEAGSFYEKAVLWAVEMGITAGTDATHFSPMASCTRAAVVTFLYRAFENPDVSSTENPFSDVPADTWYTAPILWAVENGITSGIGNGYFGVNDVCNRAQIVTFLYRACN